MKKVIYYMDMDGPLAQWDENATVYDTWQPGYFKERVLMERTVEAIRMMQKRGLDVRILSSVYNENAANEKSWWLANVAKLGIVVIYVPYGQDKSLFVQEGDDVLHVLIDDHTPNLQKWKAAGNFGIKFLNHINGNGKTWDGPVVTERMSPEMLVCTIVGTVNEYLAEKED